MIEWITAFTAHAMHIVAEGDAQDLAALFLVAALTECDIPFPLVQDSILFMLGYQITDLWLKTITVMLVLLVARETGAGIVYWLSHFIGNPIAKRIMKRFPSISTGAEKFVRRLGMKTPLAVAAARLGAGAPFASSASTFGLHAPVTVAMARLTPGLLTVTSVASGVMRIKYRYFFLGTGISSIIDDCGTILLGA